MAKTPHLTKWLAILAMTTAAAGSSTALAQKFPQTENGTTVYYKLVSACTDYAENPLCLQDESRTNKTYAFTMKALDKDSKNQEWVLICADKEQETYHLRNRSTYRYVSTESSWVGNFCIQSFATRQTASNALTITDLGDDQVAISYEDEYGKRYLSATNIDKAQPDMPSDMKDSQWAWKVFRASDLASGIHEACTPEVQVWVENQRIQVSGTDTWELYDVSGMLLPHDSPVHSNHIYLVKAKGSMHKVIIK